MTKRTYTAEEIRMINLMIGLKLRITRTSDQGTYTMSVRITDVYNGATIRYKNHTFGTPT